MKLKKKGKCRKRFLRQEMNEMKRILKSGENTHCKPIVKKPIQRSLLLSGISFMLLLSAFLAFFSYRVFSKALYDDYDSRLLSVVTLIEHSVDADDLAQCLADNKGLPEEERVTSVKYDQFQQFLNTVIDDFGLDYIYLVIPDPENALMHNAISATSAAEREAGETDMPIWDQSDAYSAEELERYNAFWNADTINYFEESSDWGVYYTACKPLRDSQGETVALICVDLSSEYLHHELNTLLIYSILSAVIMIGLFAFIIIVWFRKKVTTPLLALENSTRNYASRNRDKTDIRDFSFDMPNINTENEVQSLGEAINKMAVDMQNYIEEIITAEKVIGEKEQENLRLAEKAKAAAEIAELKESVSALLANMPAMTFSKDVESGQYVACNRAFAEYAQKETTEEVIGLTDKDIFSDETAERIAEDDKKVLSMDKPYIFYEEVLNREGDSRQVQTTKMKFTDPSGKLCILAMCLDITEMNEIKKETILAKAAYQEARDASVTYSNIARALATDYSYLYYIDLKTDNYIEYSSEQRSGEELGVERKGKDFFGESRREALTHIYSDDREVFTQVFTKANVLHAIKKQGKFTLTYRLILNNSPVYVNMKATMMENDDGHLIIGVNNVDAQMKYQEAFERVAEERITYSRITALSGDYISIYTVDPNTDHYLEYSTTKDYEGLGLAKSGDDFFNQAIKESKRVVYSEDIKRFNSVFSKEKILKEIKKNKLFIHNYRLILGDEPIYVCLKATIIEEKDGPQLIIGISNIDAQVKREEEYQHNLSMERNKANLDALTGVKNKHAYVDFEEELNKHIDKGDKKLHFAIVVFDVNDLKKVNDTLGHNRGDLLIKQASQIICDTFKHSPVFRVGGDEFAVIAQDRDYDNIDELLEKIHESNRQNIGTENAVIACGMARFETEKNVSAVFERADVKMYENKKKLKDE